jgi:hypothetical protein
MVAAAQVGHRLDTSLMNVHVTRCNTANITSQLNEVNFDPFTPPHSGLETRPPFPIITTPAMGKPNTVAKFSVNDDSNSVRMEVTVKTSREFFACYRNFATIISFTSLPGATAHNVPSWENNETYRRCRAVFVITGSSAIAGTPFSSVLYDQVSISFQTCGCKTIWDDYSRSAGHETRLLVYSPTLLC